MSPVARIALFPTIGITTKTKGRSSDQITFTFKFNHNQNITKLNEQTERTHSSEIRSSITFRKSGGFLTK